MLKNKENFRVLFARSAVMFTCGHLKYWIIMSGCGAKKRKTIKETDPAILVVAACL